MNYIFLNWLNKISIQDELLIMGRVLFSLSNLIATVAGYFKTDLQHVVYMF